MSSLPHQKHLLDHHVEERRWWVIALDALRADVGAELIPEYLDVRGDVVTATNGGIGFTSTWFAAMFPGDYRALCVNPQPIHTFQSGPGYDERQHFALAPSFGEFEWDAERGTCPPEEVARVTRTYKDGEFTDRLADLGYITDAEAGRDMQKRGLIRFLQPHAPFLGLEGYTASRADRVNRLATAVRSGDLDHEDVRDAYEQTARWALETVADLVDELDGVVVVTADHGELLGEDGLWLHAGEHGERPELHRVPWAVIE